MKFGLGLPEDAKLPVHVASLRFENGLAHYTKARYDFLGKRLSDHKVGEGVAYYGMRGEDIVVCVCLCKGSAEPCARRLNSLMLATAMVGNFLETLVPMQS